MIAIHTPTPLQKITFPFIDEKGVELYIKRDELTHPEVQGNKWRKLKHNLSHFQEHGYQQLLTFGGPVSNHIHATAAAGNLLNIKTIGVIRGYEHLPLTSTLAFAKEMGMELIFLNKEEYQNRLDTLFLQERIGDLNKAFILPDGGSNQLAIVGVKEMIDEIEMAFDYCAVGIGTGCTMAGCILNNNKTPVIGFSSLKGEGIENDVSAYLNHQKTDTAWHINKDYQFGGYGKLTDELLHFIRDFYLSTHILLDPIYTSKMMYGITDLIKKDFFKRGSRIVAIHSGGLQAWNSSEKLTDFLMKMKNR